MQGGSSQGLALTAYVWIALLQNQNNSFVESSKLTASIAKARQFLEDEVSSAASDPYALSIIAYALSLANSSKVNDVLQKLEALATVEAGTKHWQKLDDIPAPDEHRSWEPPYSQARAINIEMTAYVLRAYCQLKDISKSLPIAKWIIGQRNANGGFSSTQDTVVALAALADFASLIIGPSSERNLEVTLATDSVKYSFSPVTDETAILLQSYQLPSETEEVNISATGSGAVLVQLNAIYNVYKTEDTSGIELGVTTEENGNKITITSCGSYKQNGGSGMVAMEFNQLTGYEVTNLDDIRNQVKSIKRVENNHGNLVLYFDELTESETCVDIVSDKVFAVSKVKDASVKVYPYYDPSAGQTMFYSAPKALSVQSPCEECPQCCAESVITSEQTSGSQASSGLKMAFVTCILLIAYQLHAYILM
jgi:CD109 antigen